MKKLPLTIENRWDILYRDFPEIYDEFAEIPKRPSLLEILMQRFDFHDKVIADIGSGTGLSAFAFAAVARKVIGVEIEGKMRAVAEREKIRQGFANVEFIQGDARDIPLRDDFVDIVTADHSIYISGGWIQRFRQRSYKDRIKRRAGTEVNWQTLLAMKTQPMPGRMKSSWMSLIFSLEISIPTRSMARWIQSFGPMDLFLAEVPLNTSKPITKQISNGDSGFTTRW